MGMVKIRRQSLDEMPVSKVIVPNTTRTFCDTYRFSSIGLVFWRGIGVELVCSRASLLGFVDRHFLNDIRVNL